MILKPQLAYLVFCFVFVMRVTATAALLAVAEARHWGDGTISDWRDRWPSQPVASDVGLKVSIAVCLVQAAVGCREHQLRRGRKSQIARYVSL